jgi:hypothetical protein
MQNSTAPDSSSGKLSDHVGRYLVLTEIEHVYRFNKTSLSYFMGSRQAVIELTNVGRKTDEWSDFYRGAAGLQMHLKSRNTSMLIVTELLIWN